MPKTEQFQTNFGAGELDPDLYARQDTEQYQNGAKSLRNRRVLTTGGTVRRPGTWREPTVTQQSLVRPWIVNRTTQYVAAFSQGRVDFFARDVVTGALSAAGSLTSCPWTGTIWQNLCVSQSGNTMFVAAAGMRTQVLTRTGASSWSRADFAFATGPAGRIEQPFLKQAPASMTLAPSALTGTVTLTASAAWFTAQHVGTQIRYQKRSCTITAFTSATQVTATVVETLPGTFTLTVAASANFAVGETVTGSVSGARGTVAAIGGATSITVVLTDKLIAFTTSDRLVGPQADTTISAVATATPAAITAWDEQLFSPIFGYPSVVTIHRNRIIFAGHESAGNYLIASQLDNLYNFNVGTGADADAILESIGDAAASRIVHVFSAENLIVATDTGFYYCPESAQNPFTPSRVAFFPFGSLYTISPTVRPVPYDNGVLFAAGNLILLVRPTGDFNAAWNVDEVSLLSQHLFKAPVDLCAVTSYAGGSERYGVFVNTDGTLAVLQVITAQKIRNAVPWSTDRADHVWRSVCAIEGVLYAHGSRLINGATAWTIERFDQDLTLDYAQTSEDLASGPITSVFGSTTPNVITTSGFHLGTFPVALPSIPAGPYRVGLFYGSEIETMPPVIEGQGGSKAGEYMRITEALVQVRSSARFGANGYELDAYQVGDDPGLAPPLKDGIESFQFLGWIKQPTVKITQSDPLPLRVLGIKTTVAY